MCVRWNKVISRGYGVSNGLGPTSGGVVSVYLFCVYMCGLRKLNDTKVGCMIGTTLINQLIYADNLVLLHVSPSAMGVSLLLSVC